MSAITGNAKASGFGRQSDRHLTTWLTDDVRDEFEKAGYWDDETWLDYLLRFTEEDPRALHVADETGSLTRGEVLEQSTRLAAYLRARGIGSGDVVTLILPNWREFAVVHTAVGLIGGVVNPVLPKLGASEIRHVVTTAHSRFVFVAEQAGQLHTADAARAAAAGVESVVGIVTVRACVPGPECYETILCQDWEAEDRVAQRTPDARGWDTVTFTSGTEAMPKGVVHSHQSTMFGLRAYIKDTLGLSAADVVFMPSPVCHASGLQWGLRTAIYTGAPLILQDRWNPESAMELIDKYQCTYTLAATPFIIDLIAARAAGHGTGTSLRYVASGGAPIPRTLVAKVRETFGAQLMAVFGASETYVTTATIPGSPEQVLATDGSPLPGVQVAIIDQEGAPVQPGVDGEILTRGPQVFLGYLGDPDLTVRTFRGQWYCFGDLGHFDSAGMLHVTGRIKDIIIRGGENISAREIEELLLSCPAIDSAAVVGYPDARLGERCCAVIVVAQYQPAPTLVDLNEFLGRAGLARFKQPERLEIVPEMPMTTTGKIRKSVLRDRLLSDDR